MGEVSRILFNTSVQTLDNSYLALMRRTALISAQRQHRSSGEETLAQAITPSGQFCTGSSYTGEWDVLGMVGRAQYKIFTGEEYSGMMIDSQFHGVGKLKWPCGAAMEGLYSEGDLIKTEEYHFADGHKVGYRTYCEMPDRRFYIEKERGIRPGGISYLTDNPTARKIPDGCYDAGDGFYNPITKCVYNPKDPTEILRIPTKKEHDWIIAHCRKAWDEVAGYKPEFYEDWIS